MLAGVDSGLCHVLNNETSKQLWEWIRGCRGFVLKMLCRCCKILRERFLLPSDICYFSACKSLERALLTGFQRTGWRCWEKENQAHSAFVVWAPSKKFLPGWMRRLLGPSALFDPFMVTLPRWVLLSHHSAACSLLCIWGGKKNRCVLSSSGYVNSQVNKEFKGANLELVFWREINS